MHILLRFLGFWPLWFETTETIFNIFLGLLEKSIPLDDLVLFQSMYYLTDLKKSSTNLCVLDLQRGRPQHGGQGGGPCFPQHQRHDLQQSDFHIKAIMITTSAIHTIIIQTDCNTYSHSARQRACRLWSSRFLGAIRRGLRRKSQDGADGGVIPFNNYKGSSRCRKYVLIYKNLTKHSFSGCLWQQYTIP